MLYWFNTIQAFLIGICIGSFLNVVFYRLPKDISLVKLRSFCPKCKNKISWRENIPLISWIIQKGKCLNCNEKISIRYPIIEFSTGFLFVIFQEASPDLYNLINNNFPENLFSWFFISILYIVALIDIKHFWIPQIFIKLGFFVGIINLLSINLANNFEHLNLLIAYFLASLASYLLFEFIRVSAKYYFKKDALGKGDSKLVSMMALWLGPMGILISLGITYIFAAFCLLIAIQFKILERKQIIPFAPFISFGGMVVWFFGNQYLVDNFFRY